MEKAIIDGYAAAAPRLIPQYEAVVPSELFAPVMHLFPDGPCRIVDLGAGTGTAAAWFAARGHKVLAVEPVAEFRAAGKALHNSPDIEWLDDMLPVLGKVLKRREAFDLVLLSAVWHHLNTDTRRRAMAGIRALMVSGGLLVVSLRNGPGDASRPCYPANPEEIIDLAQATGLRLVLCEPAVSVQIANRTAGVTWEWLVFVAGGEDALLEVAR